MASRDRETAVVVASQAKPLAEIRGGSAFRRGAAGDFEERQISGPRRFGFGGNSPPRRHQGMYEPRPSPPRGSNYHHDTPRHSSILPSSSRPGSRPGSPPSGRYTSAPAVPALLTALAASNDVRAAQHTASDVTVADQVAGAAPQHPVFSQLALVLGFELAKKVTDRHPAERDMNRLANLALDIGSGTASAPDAVAVAAATTPSRSASTTSHASNASSERRPARGGAGSFRANRSPIDDGRRFGRGGSRVAGGFRGRTTSTPNSTVDDSFVTAVTPTIVSPSSAPSAPLPALTPTSPRAATVASSTVSCSTTDLSSSDDVRTDSTAAEAEDDLIDWDAEAVARPLHIEGTHSSPPMVESSHLLD